MPASTGQTLTSIINTMTDVVTMSVPWALLFLLFYWNIYKLITESDNAEKRKQAVPRLVWSIIAITIVFSLGGLINIISNTLLGQSSSTFAPSGSSGSSIPSGTASPGSSANPGGTTPSPTTPSPSTPGGSGVTPRSSSPDPFSPGTPI